MKAAPHYGFRSRTLCQALEEVRDLIWDNHSVEETRTPLSVSIEFFSWVEATGTRSVQIHAPRSPAAQPATPVTGRLREEALYVKIGGKNIAELLSMNVDSLIGFFENLSLTEYETAVAKKAIDEIMLRLRCIRDVGLSYLTMDRACNTLSGGESQRINLVKALGSSLVGSMYILDEPSIGLHPRDTARLIDVLKRLRDIGNTCGGRA